MKFSPRSRAFSLLEMLATVGMVAIVGTVTLFVITGTYHTSKEQKLESDVVTLNHAVIGYLSNGGDLSTAVNVHQVISKLKTVADATGQKVLPGYRGSFVDGRLIAVDADPATTGMRAIWNTTTQRFEIGNSGQGVKEFKLQEAPTADFEVVESRTEDSLEFASASTWVWDYEDANVISAAVTNPISTTDIDITASPTTTSMTQLNPPVFSFPGGQFPYSDFATMTTTLMNPPGNPAGTELRYSADGLTWTVYDGTPISINPDQQIMAYAATPDPTQYYNSFVTTEVYVLDLLNFGGQAGGEFHSATGPDPSQMVSTYVQNGYDAGFEWGEGSEGFTSGSTLAFNSHAFDNVQPENWFKLGTLDYFNSTILMATEATSVWFDLALNLTSPSIMETFSFELALENTENLVTNTADQNADFVKLVDPSMEFSVPLNGQSYELQLQFGYLGTEGFATVDEFHVHEGATATADLWGYFTPAVAGD